MSTVDSCSKVCSCGGVAASDVTGTFYCTLCGENVSLQSAKRNAYSHNIVAVSEHGDRFYCNKCSDFLLKNDINTTCTGV